MTSRKLNLGRKLAFQPLENRMLMAGNVAVSVQNHALVINGDNKANDIHIVQTGDGQYKILNGDGSTTINGKSTAQTFSGVTADFKINLNGGGDILSISSYGGLPRVTIPRNLQLNLGSGDDIFQMTNVDVKGGVSITGGSGDRILSFTTSHIGTPEVNSGNNDCTINLGSGSIMVVSDYTTVERDMTVKLNGDHSSYDFASLRGGYVGRNLTIQTGSGDDFVSLYEFTVKSKLQIQTGDGDDKVGLGESMFYQNGVFDSAGNQYGISADQIFADLGDGNDDLRLCYVNAKQASYAGGDDHDQVFHDQPDFGSESFSGFEFDSAHLATVLVHKGTAATRV